MSTDMTCYDSSVKLLITGLPKSGKSTLLASLVSRQNGVAQGFITREIKNGDKRTGFEIVTSNGEHALLAQSEIETDFPVGRFYAMPDNISKALKSISKLDSADLLYVDEIGQMQMLSREFKSLLSRYLNSDGTFLASVSKVYESEDIKLLISQKDSLLFSLTESNRGNVEEAMNAALQNAKYIDDLPVSLKNTVSELARKYLHDENYTSFCKLFCNAIHYFKDRKVNRLNITSFKVGGIHGSHSVKLNNEHHWECDCALANGQKPYSRASECSHYQAVLLFLADA
jgi:nucleoside-triphosphatase THEP1